MNDNQNKRLELGPNDILLFGTLGIGIFVYKYGHRIQVWFYENMALVVFCGILFLALFGYLIYWRLEKNGREEFERMKRLQNAKAPSRNPNDYYRRPQSPNRRDYDRDNS